MPLKSWFSVLKKKHSFNPHVGMFNFGGKSTFKNILPFIKSKVLAIFELETWGLVDLSYTHCGTEIDAQYFGDMNSFIMS